ncbi:uncharacterized protein LOC144577408 isoform X2 [Callithrix jacchus]
MHLPGFQAATVQTPVLSLQSQVPTPEGYGPKPAPPFAMATAGCPSLLPFEHVAPGPRVLSSSKARSGPEPGSSVFRPRRPPPYPSPCLTRSKLPGQLNLHMESSYQNHWVTAWRTTKEKLTLVVKAVQEAWR